jgi:hypothetical protein
MPRESYFSFQRAIIAHRDEIIDIVMREQQWCLVPTCDCNSIAVKPNAS